MFKIAACELSFRCGRACCTRNTGPRRFTSYDLVHASTVISSERLRECVGGVVDHHVDAAELVDGALYQGCKIIDVAEVRGHPDGLASEAAQVLGGLLAGVGFAAGDHDAGAGQDEALRQRQPDSSGAARHDDGAAGHVEETLKGFAIHAAQ